MPPLQPSAALAAVSSMSPVSSADRFFFSCPHRASSIFFTYFHFCSFQYLTDAVNRVNLSSFPLCLQKLGPPCTLHAAPRILLLYRAVITPYDVLFTLLHCLLLCRVRHFPSAFCSFFLHFLLSLPASSIFNVLSRILVSFRLADFHLFLPRFSLCTTYTLFYLVSTLLYPVSGVVCGIMPSIGV